MTRTITLLIALSAAAASLALGFAHLATGPNDRPSVAALHLVQSETGDQDCSDVYGRWVRDGSAAGKQSYYACKGWL